MNKEKFPKIRQIKFTCPFIILEINLAKYDGKTYNINVITQ